MIFGPIGCLQILSNSSSISEQKIEFDDLVPIRELIFPLCQMDKKVCQMSKKVYQWPTAATIDLGRSTTLSRGNQ